MTEKLISSFAGRESYTGFFISPKGPEKIYYKRNQPCEASPDLIHFYIFHDISEYHGRHFLLANYLIEKFGDRVCISWLDFRGHGMSNGTRGHIDDIQYLCEDSIEFINTTSSHYDEACNILLGQGLGALVILRLQQSFMHKVNLELAGIILVNPLLRLFWQLPVIKKHFLENKILEKITSDKFRENFLKLKFPKKIYGDDLTSDQKLGNEYNKDALNSHYITLGAFMQINNCAKLVKKGSYFINMPNLVLVSKKDEITGHEATLLFQKSIPQSLSALKCYPQGHHDILNDTCRALVFDDIYEWVDGV